MSDRSAEDTSSVVLSTTSVSDRLPPPWAAQALVLLQYWKHTGRLDRLLQVSWDRPAHDYDLVDLVLVLLLALIARAPSLRAFYRDVDVVGPALAAVWGRRRLPSRAQAAALLRTVPTAVVAALDPFLSRTCAPRSRPSRPSVCTTTRARSGASSTWIPRCWRASRPRVRTPTPRVRRPVHAVGAAAASAMRDANVAPRCARA